MKDNISNCVIRIWLSKYKLLLSCTDVNNFDDVYMYLFICFLLQGKIYLMSRMQHGYI